MTLTYFGAPWDAPITDHAVQVSTPVGETCLFCPDAIGDGDQGLMLSYADVDEQGAPRGGLGPVHRECFLQQTVRVSVGCAVATPPESGSGC